MERTIGILKGRWKILGYEKRGRYTPEKMARFVNVCSALHNICMLFKVPFNQPNSGILDTSDIYVGEDTRISGFAQNIRNQIKQSVLNYKNGFKSVYLTQTIYLMQKIHKTSNKK